MFKHERKNQQTIAAVQNIAKEKHEKLILAEEVARQEELSRSFTNMPNSKPPSVKKFREKRKYLSESFDQIFNEVVATIVSDASSTPKEQIKARIATFPTDLLDIPQYDQSAVRTLDIGGISDVTPRKLATAAISTVVCHDGGKELLEKAGFSTGYNVMDTLTTLGGDEQSSLKTEQAVTILKGLVGKVSGSIQDRATTAIYKDIERIQNGRIFNEDVMTEGLSHISAKRMRKQMRAENKKPNIIREIFNYNSVLTECTETEATPMGSTVIDMMILETYNVLGCVNKTPEEICESFKKMRNGLDAEASEKYNQ